MSTRKLMLMTVAAVSGLVLASTSTFAQQSSAQQKCLNAINKDGAAVAKTQGKESIGCLKSAGKGVLTGPAVQACLTADAKGKVQKAKDKTSADQTKNCGTAPTIGYTSAAAINTAAQQGEIDLTADVFNTDLGAAAISCTTNKPGCTCQQKVQKIVEQLASTKLSTFVSCKKTVLAAGANTNAALMKCVNDAATAGSIAADTKGKIAKLVTKLNDTITKSCDTPGVTGAAFPGVCTGLNDGMLATCLDTHVECRVCQTLNEMEGFVFVNCDLFDNGVADATCLSGTGPTPTPSVTPTPTPSATATFQPGTIFKGAISRTIGHWTYQAMNGTAGGTAECATKFPGTHLCSLAELQTAESMGELLAAADVDNLSIDHFWAVDAGATDFHQCITAPPGTPTRWAYATAHTASKGDFVTLNAGTGDLGVLNQPGGVPVSCNASAFSVGCCM